MMKALLVPVFVQVALTLGLLLALGRSRVKAVRQGQVVTKDIALGQQDAWPESVRKIGRAYENQFETPVLFYALVALAVATNTVDGALVAGAWAYVAARLVHAAIHVTSNRVTRRFQAFITGFSILALMWIDLAVRILSA